MNTHIHPAKDGIPEHEPVWGEWHIDPEYPSLWRRDCTIEGCTWRQQSSEEPGHETPLGKALNKLVGIE